MLRAIRGATARAAPPRKRQVKQAASAMWLRAVGDTVARTGGRRLSPTADTDVPVYIDAA